MPCVNYNGIVACNVNPSNGLSHIIQNPNGTYEVWAYQPSLGEYAWVTVPASGIPTQSKKPINKSSSTQSQCITMPWNNICVPISQLGEDEQIALALENMQIEKEQSAPKPVTAPTVVTGAEPTPVQSTAPSHKNLVYYIIIGVLALVVIWLA